MLAFFLLVSVQSFNSLQNFAPYFVSGLAVTIVSVFAIILNNASLKSREKKYLKENAKIRIKDLINLFKQGFVFFVPSISAILLLEGSVLVAMLSVSFSELGYFSVAQKISLLCAFFLNSINSVVQPILAKYSSRGDEGLTRFISQKASLYVGLLTIPIIVILFFFSDIIIKNIFSEQFSQSADILRILLFGQLINTLFACMDPYLTMTGKQNALARIVLFSDFCGVILSYTLPSILGGSGQTLAYSILIAQIIWRVLGFCYIYLTEGWFFSIFSIFFYENKYKSLQ